MSVYCMVLYEVYKVQCFYILMHDVGHIDDLFPYFLAYARWRYPEEASMSSLKRVSDFTSPPAWYDPPT